jgi:hypothetical protein
MKNLWDRLSDLLKKKPVPPQPPRPDTAPDRVPYLRIWAVLSKINMRELWPALLSIPVLLFFAISGVLAWVVVVCRFLVNLWRTVS